MINKFHGLVLSSMMASFVLYADSDAAKIAKKYASGGEVTSFRYADSAGIGYTAILHTFTNTTEAAMFKNMSGRTLPVRMLVVGGGGAGMDGGVFNNNNTLRPGGGGGGGGGVTEMYVPLSIGEELSIRVGAGGRIDNHTYGGPRVAAKASSVSNDTDAFVVAPGGGAGGGGTKSTFTAATEGAAGGGGSSLYDSSISSDRKNGAAGNYHSSVLDDNGSETHTGFQGGNGSNTGEKAYGGGGGGAGSAGDGINGGVGLMSDITGSFVVYGSGGGGGGTIRLWPGAQKTYHSEGGEGGVNAGQGGSVTWSVEEGVAVTNVYLTAATMPVANTGSGGAGGVALVYKPDGINIYADGQLSDSSTTARYATPGADGIVIIRYDIPDTPCVGGDFVTAITNGYNVTYIHTFTNTAKVATFKPSITYKGTSVRLLVVGGGGAGMDGIIYTDTTLRPGGGGGGGGGVTEMYAPLSFGDEWTVCVGVGGGISDHTYGKPRKVAGSSSISNGTEEVVLVPGGGAGGGGNVATYVLPQQGAAGGGGSSNASVAERLNGAKGTYVSCVLDAEGLPVIPADAPFKGGDGKYSGSTSSYGGGGGGAGADGENQVGGSGLVSYITGTPVVYGSGGGGGGHLRLTHNNKAYGDGGTGGENAGNGGRVSYTDDRVDLVPATQPIANTGSGGAGGVSLGDKKDRNVYVNEELVDSYDSARYATPGADGVVIIRYEAVLDHPKGTVVVFR